MKDIRSTTLRYGLALGSFAITLFIALVLRHFSININLTILIVVVLLGTTWYGGRGPGLLLAFLLEAATIILTPAAAQTSTGRLIFAYLNLLVLLVTLVLLVSGRKRAEQEREQLLKREREARAEAEDASRLKDEFLTTVSHELRTPLNAILGWALMLNRRHLEEETIRTALGVIERNAKAQAHIIDDILDVSRIISGRLRLDPRPINLGPVIQAAIDTVRPAAAAKGITLTVLLDSNAGLVSGDPNRLQQIIWNLVCNAIKFTPKDGWVEVRLERADSHVQVVVSDSGVGIDKGFLPHIFDRFRQADSSMTRSFSGVGLGLAIVRHLVELHGGSVSAESDGVGQGATLTVTLPIREYSDAVTSDESGPLIAARPKADDLYEGHDLPLTGLRILAVDDDPDALQMLKVALTGGGAEVRTAMSAAEGLSLLHAYKPDVLVSDIAMPGENGYSLISKVRALPTEEGGAIPGVALTALARVEDRIRALETGFQMYVTKPVEPVELIAAIADLVSAFEQKSSRL